MTYKNVEDRKKYHRRWYNKNRVKRIKDISLYNNKRRKYLKQMAVDLLGGKCEICGYNKCIEALDFHHKENKKYNISNLIEINNKEKLVSEVNKCRLLCANCHREIHSG